jgi:hypothetical protein
MSLPIDLALADCEKEAILNWTAIANKHGVHRTTLRRRFQGSQRSFVESRSENVQRLTLEQEKVLISFIDTYSD